MSFQVGDITIFPGRGVGKIISIDDIERADGDAMVEFRVYRIRFPADPLSSAGLESILEIPFQKNGEDLPKETMPCVRLFNRWGYPRKDI